METLASWGGLLPLWILGMPLVVGIFALFTTPKPGTSRDDDRVRYSPAVAARPA